ncbi:MAG: amidase domain-containing protein, partial [Firmicutes bacterium]|nr:amidase domain-containing protein [Bacillota bacterium]
DKDLVIEIPKYTINQVKEGGRWYIRRDWFIDPLEEDAVVSAVEPAKTPRESSKAHGPGGNPNQKSSPGIVSAPGGYDRRAAVAYANKYAGLALGTDARYNPAYRDYTNAGGDCTNFVSQVLSDQEGGKLKQDYVWAYSRTRTGQGGGSRAWTQAPALVDYLLGRGRARLVGRGTYLDLVRPDANFPYGAVGALEEGDVIGYEEKGRLEHLAVMVGRDSRGYPLVNSHTADRYRVPWDLGWDKRTVFWFLHIVE